MMMKNVARLVGATIVVAALTGSQADAAPITFYSGDGGDLANGLAAVNIAPHPAWGDVSEDAGLEAGTAQWISFVDSGYEGEFLPTVDSREIGDETALFTRTFELLSDSLFSLWILADDTATVRLLGPGGYNNTLFTAYPDQLDPCAPGGSGNGLGCVQFDMGVATLTNLAAGLYTLEVYAFQTNGNVFGAQYAGNYEGNAGNIESVPEPGSLLLLATGAGFVAIRKRFRGPADRLARQ